MNARLISGIAPTLTAARESFSGKTMTDTQLKQAVAIADVIYAEIQQSGSFIESLTDFSHAFARNEKFDATRAEKMIRDVYTATKGQSMNQTREGLTSAKDNLPDIAKTRALDCAESIGELIQAAPTQPFYMAYDRAAVTLSAEFSITQNAAKALMKDVFEQHHGQELYAHGKDIEEAYHRPVRETADIQAVIAADYVRNLREECLKGIEGRLKQGIFPFSAPIGYLNKGGGKPKIPDPERAPYVRRTFEMYATQTYSFRGLLVELKRQGSRNRAGKPITKGCLENLLNNPFYYGVIRLKRSGRKYSGCHEPIISKALFDRVQAIKSDRQHKKQTVHNHTYRRLFRCGRCQNSLYNEKQKGWVYLRCHSKTCPPTSIREDVLDADINGALMSLKLNHADQKRIERKILVWIKSRSPDADRKALELQLAQVDDRQEKLTDALLDGLIDKETFEKRRDALSLDRDELSIALSEVSDNANDERFIQNFLELVKSLCLLHQIGNPAQKRRITEIAFSNRTLTGKKLYLEPHNWLQDIDLTLGVLFGGPQRDRIRMKNQIAPLLDEFGDQGSKSIP